MVTVKLQWLNGKGRALATLEYERELLPQFEDEIEDVLGSVADALNLDFVETKVFFNGKEQ